MLNFDHRYYLLPVVAEEWAKEDPGAALKFLEVSDSSFRQSAAMSVIKNAYPEDAVAGLGWMRDHMGVLSYSGPDNLLVHYLAKDPQGVEKYLANLTAVAEQNRAISGLANAYALIKPIDETIGWLLTVPETSQMAAADVILRRRCPVGP